MYHFYLFQPTAVMMTAQDVMQQMLQCFHKWHCSLVAIVTITSFTRLYRSWVCLIESRGGGWLPFFYNILDWAGIHEEFTGSRKGHGLQQRQQPHLTPKRRRCQIRKSDKQKQNLQHLLQMPQSGLWWIYKKKTNHTSFKATEILQVLVIYWQRKSYKTQNRTTNTNTTQTTMTKGKQSEGERCVYIPRTPGDTSETNGQLITGHTCG